LEFGRNLINILEKVEEGQMYHAQLDFSTKIWWNHSHPGGRWRNLVFGLAIRLEVARRSGMVRVGGLGAQTDMSGVFRTGLTPDDGALAVLSDLFCLADDDGREIVGTERL
jgi:hypothetical protein